MQWDLLFGVFGLLFGVGTGLLFHFLLMRLRDRPSASTEDIKIQFKSESGETYEVTINTSMSQEEIDKRIASAVQGEHPASREQ